MFDFRLNLGVGWMIFMVLLIVVPFVALNIFFYFKTKNRFKLAKGNVAVITVGGNLIKYDSRPNSNFQKIISQIKKVKEMKPKALVVRVNSPGGVPGACHEVYEELKEVRALGTKVVALMEDVAASGGVYIAMAAEKIVATPGTITGSIGVIIHRYDMSSILGKINVKVENIKSGQHKDLLSSWVPLSDESRQILQGTINSCYEQFCKVVSESRGMPIEVVKTFADGRIMSAKEAEGHKLVDYLGGFGKAVEVARDLAEIPKGQEKLEEVAPSVPLVERLGLLPGISATVERLDGFMAISELRGMPLWLMER